MNTHRVVSLAFLVALAGLPTLAAAEPVVAAEVTTVATSTTAPKPASNADSARYAQREKQSPAAATFEGGNTTIYIGGTLVTVLLIFILIVLI